MLWFDSFDKLLKPNGFIPLGAKLPTPPRIGLAPSGLFKLDNGLFLRLIDLRFFLADLSFS